tara:strand:+ start:111 stop:491 length:381 start_codon:yes stop_codon:yes gene_type:complete
MKSNITSKIIPFFYFIFGITFIFLPVLPLSDLITEIDTIESNNVLEAVLRGVGILFLSFAILIYRIFIVSPSLYKLLNSTFIFIFTFLSIIGPIIYLGASSNPIELLLFSGVNIAIVFFFFVERKE